MSLFPGCCHSGALFLPNSYLLLLIGVFVWHLILFIEVRIGNNVSRSFGIGHLVS